MLLLACILGCLSYGMASSTLGTTLPELRQRWSLTPARMGMFALLQAIGLIVSSSGAGWWMDAQGRRVPVMLALALSALSVAMLPRSRSFTVACAWFFLSGIGLGCISTGYNSLIPSIDPANMASISNFVQLFFGLGGLLTPLLAARLFQGRLNAACLAVAATLLLAMLAIAPAEIPTLSAAANAGLPLEDLRFWLLCFMLFVYVAAEICAWNWLAPFFIAQGLPAQRALTLLSLGFGAGLLLGRLAAAVSLRGADPKLTLVIAAAGIALATAGLLMARRPALLAATVFASGFTMGPIFPTVISLVNQIFPGNASVVGVAVTAGWAGLAISSYTIGRLAGGEAANLKRALVMLPSLSLALLLAALRLMA
jgi:fucose permease